MGTVSSELISASKLSSWGEDEAGLCGGIFAWSPPKWGRVVGLRGTGGEMTPARVLKAISSGLKNTTLSRDFAQGGSSIPFPLLLPFYFHKFFNFFFFKLLLNSLDPALISFWLLDSYQ